MKFSPSKTTSLLTLLTLLTLTLTTTASVLPLTKRSSSPSPQTTNTCTGGSYDSCVADVICVQSVPESCECRNTAKRNCAKACANPQEPEYEVCSAAPAAAAVEKNKKCYDKCMGGKKCNDAGMTQVESCECGNYSRGVCAAECGVEGGEAVECGV